MVASPNRGGPPTAQRGSGLQDPNADPAGSVTPGAPRWITALAFALVATAAICWPVWPGQMNYDGLYAYGSSIEGIRSMVWPPMHAYLFWLSRAAGVGAGGLLAAQVFALFFGVALAAGLMIRSRAGAWAASAAFALIAVVVAPMLGVLLVHFRDVPTTSFAVLSLAAWLLAARLRAPGWLVAAAGFAGLAVSLRYNAAPLFAFTAPLMIWRPYLDGRAQPRARAVAAIALAVGFGLAWASVQWRLPDFKRLPAPHTLQSVQLFDLLGVSACAGRSYLPPSVARGQPLTAAQVRQIYDPRHLQLAFGPHPGVPQIYATQKYMVPQMRADIARSWTEAVSHHFGCYLAHRSRVFAWQMGIVGDHVFLPTHGDLDANRYGLALARPEASKAVTTYVWRAAAARWRRPYLLYLGAALAVGLLAARRDPRAPLALALLGGAFANAGVLYLVAPAADARYIFASNVLCAFLIVCAAAIFTERAPGARAEHVRRKWIPVSPPDVL